MRSSPGSRRSMTSPSDTRSNTPLPLGLTLNIVRLLALTAHPSAVHHENVTVDVVAGSRAQEDRGPRDVRGLAPPARRYPLQDLPAARRVVLEGLRVVGADVPRGDGVHVDALRRPFVRQRLGELRDAALRGGV